MAMEEQEIHLRDYLKVIQKRRYTVATFFVVVFVVVLIGTLSTKPVYMATTKLVIEKSERASLMMNYAYSAYDPEFLETQFQLIKSASVGRKVVDMLGLDKTYDSYFKGEATGFSPLNWIIGGLKGLTSAVFGSKRMEEVKQGDVEREEKADMIAKLISGGIVVKPVKNSRVVEIGYMSTNPHFSQAVVNTVAKAYIEEILDLNMSSTRYTIQWMTKKAEEEKEKIESSEKVMQNFMRSHNFVALENKMAIVPQKMQELNSQAIRAEARKKEMETLYNKVKQVAGNPEEGETMTVIATDPTFQSIRQQMLKAEQNIMELSQKYGKKHPAMIRALEDLNVLKAKKDQEVRRIIESIKNEYEIAVTNEANLNRMMASSKGEAISLNEKFMEYGIISREVETNRQMYDALIKRIKEQSITDQIQTVNVLVVEKAGTPKVPVKPRKGLNVMLGIIVGLLGGVGVAFFIEYLDYTVKSPEDAEAKLGIPVLGMVQLFPQGKVAEDIVINEPTSTFAENYKAIRTALLLSSAERPPKNILITSAGPSEGKTTTALNLALAIAQSEYTVLLVDADLRRPRIHKILGLDNSKGLSTYLAGASDMDIIKGGPLPNLSIVTSGPIPPNPSELLSSSRLNEAVGSWSKNFDIIIVDSPPLMTVADSLIISKIVDGTIIVTRGGKTSYEVVKKGLRALAGLDSHVLGMLINAVDVKKGDYSYYHYYNYYYSSEKASKKQQQL